MKLNSFVLLGLLSLLFVTSCVRERDVDITHAEDQTLGEFVYNDILDIVTDASFKNTGEQLSNYNVNSICASITHDKISMPRSLIIDFGSANCLCTDGRNRTGKIIVSYTGNNYDDSLSNATISLDNYIIDNVTVLGTLEVAHKGTNVAHQPYYEVNTKGRFLKPQVFDTLDWNAYRVKTKVKGYDNSVLIDDVYELTGTGNGLNEYKLYYATNITKPLVKAIECKHINEGKIELQPQGKTLRSLNYGNGNCDKNVSVTLNTKEFNIQLK